ncbi:MAG TPA: 5-(carboxyamino)imidazole ribonucleotide synthase [Gemmatimonadaceae bacterium]|nr:5-(carboxyamino)imidazole ribonucleotide synthase [Gemmatimonadaceae bacterium]
MNQQRPILPGAAIGILGGGQLGRMTAMAARTLGYDVHALDPDPECPARPVVDRLVSARFDDAAAAADLARNCAVITLEIEQIAQASLAAAARHAPVRPGAELVGIVQDRAVQKRWIAAHGFPLGAYADVTGVPVLEDATRRLGSLFVKSNHGGYDGRSQVRVHTPGDAESAWRALGGRPAVAEQALELEAELSVLVARAPGGETAVYPPALNHHERQVLAWSVIPAPLPSEVTTPAIELARGIAEAIGLEGLLAVELFLVRDGRLLVNELAPRPHNSFHETELACLTSQFEQLVRAVCGLPLGDTAVLRPAAIVNLFGDLWRDGVPPRFDAALAEPHTRLHLYGKRVARAGRKMGHISAVGATPEDALARARAAAARLVQGDHRAVT